MDWHRNSCWAPQNHAKICLFIVLPCIDRLTLYYNGTSTFDQPSTQLPRNTCINFPLSEVVQIYEQTSDNSIVPEITMLLKSFEVFPYQQWDIQQQEAWQRRWPILQLKTLLHLHCPKWKRYGAINKIRKYTSIGKNWIFIKIVRSAESSKDLSFFTKNSLLIDHKKKLEKNKHYVIWSWCTNLILKLVEFS